jgi:hypothetical protein
MFYFKLASSSGSQWTFVDSFLCIFASALLFPLTLHRRWSARDIHGLAFWSVASLLLALSMIFQRTGDDFMKETDFLDDDCMSSKVVSVPKAF